VPKLLFQDHGSYRLTADDGRVIYEGGRFFMPENQKSGEKTL